MIQIRSHSPSNTAFVNEGFIHLQTPTVCPQVNKNRLEPHLSVSYVFDNYFMNPEKCDCKAAAARPHTLLLPSFNGVLLHPWLHRCLLEFMDDAVAAGLLSVGSKKRSTRVFRVACRAHAHPINMKRFSINTVEMKWRFSLD